MAASTPLRRPPGAPHEGASSVRRSPRRRPPAALRAIIGLTGFVTLLVTGMLLLSDRAPGLLTAMFGDRVKQVWARIDNGGRTDVVTDVVRPEADFVVHVALWATVACLVGLAVWSWFGLVAAAAGVFSVSVVTEFAQGVWSSTREVELSDVAANAVGVACGTLAAATMYVVWSGLAALFARRP